MRSPSPPLAPLPVRAEVKQEQTTQIDQKEFATIKKRLADSDCQLKEEKDTRDPSVVGRIYGKSSGMGAPSELATLHQNGSASIKLVTPESVKAAMKALADPGKEGGLDWRIKGDPSSEQTQAVIENIKKVYRDMNIKEVRINGEKVPTTAPEMKSTVQAKM